MNPDPARAGKRTAALSLAGLVAALAAGCAVNPATGRKQAMLMSEETEFRIGRQADAAVRKQYGVYLEKPELRAYVSSVGEQLAAKSARPAIEYHFELIDTPIVNAFALPGGFVYITRGILAQMNSEDELGLAGARRGREGRSSGRFQRLRRGRAASHRKTDQGPAEPVSGLK